MRLSEMEKHARVSGAFRSVLALLLPGMLLCAVAPRTARVSAQNSGARIVDEIVATINGDPVLWSDILWQVALAPEGEPKHLDAETKDRVLQAIIDTRLLHQEAEKLPTISVSDAEVDRALASLVSAFPSEESFRARAQSAGLTPDIIRDILRHRIEVEKYTDFRFRSFVVVRDDEVKGYYERELLPAMKQRGEARSLEESRAGIIALLTTAKVAQEMETWLADARARSDIVMVRRAGTNEDRHAAGRLPRRSQK